MGSVFWRARLNDKVKEERLYVEIGMEGMNHVSKKTIVTNDSGMRFGPQLGKWSFGEGLFGNAEGFLPDDVLIRSVRTQYERARYPFLFRSLDSIVLYFLFTMVFAFGLKRIFRVTF